MEIEHIPIETVRAYLLGALASEDAAAVERQYFVNRSCLLQMRAAERTLIENYLDGVLAPREARQLESRYLRIPALKRVVDDVKRERAAAVDRARPRWRRLWFAWAGALLCAVALCVWVYLGRRSEMPPVVTGVASPRQLAAVTLRLTPGVTKGAGEQAARMDLPRESVPVKLIAELPGLPAPIECGARLSVVGADGRWTTVWNAGPTRTTGRNGRQELALLLNPSSLHPGDYILEVTTPDGRVRETYLFHVSYPR